MSGLQDEIKLLVDTMAKVEVRSVLDRRAYVGELSGQEILVVGSGVGKVRASAFAQHVIDGFHPGHMIIFGLAGALDTGLNIGDIVVSIRAVMHDYVVAGEGVNEDISIGPIVADPDLVRLAVTAGSRLPGEGRVKRGIVLTGDAVVDRSDKRAVLRREFGGDCVEMEGAAAALVCSLNHVPFVIVRAISDLADEHAHVQFEQTFDQVSRRATHVVMEMLHLMQARPGWSPSTVLSRAPVEPFHAV